MKNLNKLGLGIRLNLVVIVAAAVTLAIVFLLINNGLNNLASETGQQQATEEAQAVRQRIDAALANTLTIAKLIANSADVVQAVEEGDTANARDATLRTAAPYGVSNIDVVDAKGRVLVTFLAGGGGVFNVDSEEQLFSLALLGIESTNVIQEAGGNLLLAGAAPIRNDAGIIVGVIRLSNRLDDNFLAQLNFQREGVHLMLVHNGEIIAQSQLQPQEAGMGSEPEMFGLDQSDVSRAQAGETVIREDLHVSSSGTTHIQSYLPLLSGANESGGVIAIEIDRGHFAAAARNLILNLALAVIAGGVVAIGLVSYFVRRIVSLPIGKLREVAEDMASGQYAMRVTSPGSDEVGQLGTSFNTMAETIQKRDGDLREVNETLEQRVIDLERATAEAKGASRAKDEFLSVMSHELRTPLNAILGYQGILELTGELEDDNLEMVQRTEANARRLLGLINDVLDISRIEADRMEIVPSKLVIRDFVERIRAQIEVLANEKNINLDVQISDTVPSSIMIDEDAFGKIAVNLLGNAFKFTDDGAIVLGITTRNGDLRLTVSDSGIGIPAHMHQIIFERFRQVDSSVTRNYGGSGLGLSIVQQLCNLMGGTVAVESMVGKGSIFTVVLPLQAVEEMEMVTV